MAHLCGMGQAMGWVTPLNSFTIRSSLDLHDDAVGDITSISVLGQEIVIVNSLAIAIDMLEKKSAVYSDRPVMPMGGELVGWKNTLVLTPYSDRFRTFRRLFHQVIGSNSAMARFQPVEEEESQRFLQFLLKQPEDLATHIRRYAPRFAG